MGSVDEWWAVLPVLYLDGVKPVVRLRGNDPWLSVIEVRLSFATRHADRELVLSAGEALAGRLVGLKAREATMRGAMETYEPLADEDELTPNERALEKLRSMYGEVGFVHPEDWMKAPAVLGEDGLTLSILNHPVMEVWEDGYMKSLAEIATSNGGRVLEIGFGMGRSSRFIHENPRVTHHVIVEANHDIADLAREFAKNSSIEVTVIEGFRDDVLRELEPCSFDGMLNDTYPLNELEVNAQELCAPLAYRVLREGGVLTYFSDEPDRFRPKHLKTLLGAGFKLENIKSKLIAVTPPDDCRYWNVNTVLAPIIIK